MQNPARISQVIARLVTGLALVALAACSREAGLTLDAAEAHARARAGTLVLIDVRRLDEQRDSGIAAGARSIDMSASQGEAGFRARVLRAVDGRKDQPIALLSDVGHRAANAQTSLERAGFSHVYVVADGMRGNRAGPGWIARGLPLQRTVVAP